MKADESAVTPLSTEAFPVHVPMPALHSLYHMMAAAIIGRLLGMTSDEIARGAAHVTTIAGHGNIIHTDRYVILDDCYNANPASMQSALETLSATDRRRVAILGDMGELGENERALHGQVGSFAAGCGLDLLICVGDLAQEIRKGYEDALDGDPGAGKAGRSATCSYSNKDDLLAELPSLLHEGDAVLVKASHFMGFEDIVQALS